MKGKGKAECETAGHEPTKYCEPSNCNLTHDEQETDQLWYVATQVFYKVSSCFPFYREINLSISMLRTMGLTMQCETCGVDIERLETVSLPVDCLFQWISSNFCKEIMMALGFGRH